MLSYLLDVILKKMLILLCIRVSLRKDSLSATSSQVINLEGLRKEKASHRLQEASFLEKNVMH